MEIQPAAPAEPVKHEHPQRWVVHALFGVNVLYSRIFYEFMGVSLAPYLLAWFVFAVLLCWHAGWTRHTLWMHVYASLFAQALCDALGILLPQGFVLYAMIPLMLAGLVEIAVVAAMRDTAYRTYVVALGEHQRPKAASKMMRLVAGIYMDHDIRRYYAVLFETYMTVCSCVLAMRGSFIRAPCFAAVYALLTGLLYLAAEDMRDIRGVPDMPLPAAAVKAVYALYAPARFLQPLYALTVVLLLTGCGTSDVRMGQIVAVVTVTVAILATVMQRDIDTCPL